ncbi:YegP family protein [Luteimicrobium sp. DT211]|uniref:YegP family protein n=1 Tax=Luteimicrobium sp. DT211 TaxID=3393412 RepID=UPI003CF1899C
MEVPVKFTIHKSEKSGEFWFRIVAANGNILANSQQYAQKASAVSAIESIKQHAPGADVVDET